MNASRQVILGVALLMLAGGLVWKNHDKTGSTVSATFTALQAPSSRVAEGRKTGAFVIPRPLAHLPTDPVGVGIFGSRVVFPQFFLSGTSYMDIYDMVSHSLQQFAVPGLTGQFAYAVASDPTRNAFYVGTRTDLVAFNVSTGASQLIPLPRPHYPVSSLGPQPMPPSVLALSVATNGDVWISRDMNAGVTIYHPRAGTFSQIPLPSGVVPGSLALLGTHELVAAVYRSNNSQYDDGGNLATGVLIKNLQSGQIEFFRGFASSVATTSGTVYVTEGRNLLAIDPQSQAVRAALRAHQFAVNGKVAVSGHGVPWWADGSCIIRDGNPAQVYVIAPRYGSPALLGTTGSQQQVQLNPGISDVVPTATGSGAWAVLAGYNAIGYAGSP